MTRSEILQVAKPILFNGEMVRAILDNRKNATRRVLKPQPEHAHMVLGPSEEVDGAYDFMCGCSTGGMLQDWIETVKMPCQTGDYLYVRETWAHPSEAEIAAGADPGMFLYKADRVHPAAWGKWSPSIHMPKEAARIFLRVTDVWPERLQEITEDWAKAEGVNYLNGKNVGWEEKMRRTAIERFAEIWESTIPPKDLDKYGWNANPWVVVIEFEKAEL